MCRLGKNNEFKLTVLMYQGFMVLSMLFLKFSVRIEPFHSYFNVFLSMFVGKMSKKEMEKAVHKSV